MPFGRKKPEEIIKELLKKTFYPKYWHSQKLNLTYSDPFETDFINFPLNSKQFKALELAIKSYEEVIPITIKRTTDFHDIGKKNNFVVYNISKHSQFYSPNTKKALCITYESMHRKFNWTDKKFEIAFLRLIPEIIYQHDGGGKKDLEINPVTPQCDLTLTFRHELGHLLGLEHPKNSFELNTKFTIMSQAAPFFYNIEGTRPITLQLYDILVLQNFYGQNLKTRPGNTHYKWTNSEMGLVRCLWDADGKDTMDLSLSKYSCHLDMRDGEFSSLGQHPKMSIPSFNNFSIAYGVGLENAIASNNGDTFYLNAQSNDVTGGKGDDTVYITDQFINVRVDPRNPLYSKKFIAKQNYLDRKQYRGWGNDTFHSGGGVDMIILDVDHTIPLEFEKNGEDLIITHFTKAIYSKQNFRSSLTITNYDPKQQIIALRCKSQKMKENISKLYSKVISNAPKIDTKKLFDKRLSDFKNNDNFHHKLKEYEIRTSEITQQKFSLKSHYLALSL